jgi:YidC/Oxa1 family membrane protein insertase
VFSILGVPVDAAYHLVAGFTGILTPVLGGMAAVSAIIVFTMAVRLILMPLSLRALRGQAAMARLAPELLALRRRYARQPDRLQAEMTALYRREGTSMFAGITPLMLQWPFVSLLYLLFRSSRVGGAPNTLLSHDLLGVPLGAHWLAGAGPASPQGAVFLGVFALLAALGWLSVRLARRMAPHAAAGAAAGVAAGAAAGAAVAGQPGVLARVLPYLTVVIAAFTPLAAAIYLFTSTAWSLAERVFFWRSASGPGSSTPTPVPARESPARQP